MRGLNIGRQLDDTILINALQIFGIDGLIEKSRREGLDIARQEIPHVVDYLIVCPLKWGFLSARPLKLYFGIISEGNRPILCVNSYASSLRWRYPASQGFIFSSTNR